jgi:hypothetical protein
LILLQCMKQTLGGCNFLLDWAIHLKFYMWAWYAIFFNCWKNILLWLNAFIDFGWCHLRAGSLATEVYDLAHLEQWLAGWLKFEWICILESTQIPDILLTTVLEKSYLEHLEHRLAGWQRFEWICMMESMQFPGILLSTVLGKSYLTHMEQWLAGWLRFEWIPTAPKSENNNPATSGWRCHRRTAAGDRVSATSPFSALGSRKSWDLWALPMSLL